VGVRRLLSGVSVGLALALGVSACGGDNDPAGEPPTTAPPEPSDSRPTSPEAKNFPAAFVKKVDPICVKAQRQMDKLTANEIRDRARLKALAGVFEDTATELEALKPPAKNADAYKEFTDAFRDGQDLFIRLDGEVGRGDSSAYQRVTSTLNQVQTDYRESASDFGFTGCTGS
jgi:hypothetical protein